MTAPRCCVLRAAGTNCDQESAYAFDQAGAHSEVHHINHLLENPAQLRDFQILVIPGGFSYGDDVASGRIFATQIKQHLGDELQAFREAGKLMLGICNGFQVLVKAGLLPDFQDEHGLPEVTLSDNDSGMYEDRWVHLKICSDKSPFLKGLDRIIELPLAHAEGKFVARSETLKRLNDEGLITLRYCNPDGSPPSYPANPNGSMEHIAGICDRSGQILGLMPHPERFIEKHHYPAWTRGEKDQIDGRPFFKNAVEYFR